MEHTGNMTHGSSWGLQWYGGHCANLISNWIQGFSHLVTHPDTSPVQPGLTSMNSKEPVVLMNFLFCHLLWFRLKNRGMYQYHNHFKITNQNKKRKKKVDGWPSHSSLTMSLMFKLMLTSALTREGRVSPMFGFDTLSNQRAKKKKTTKKNRTEHRLAQFKCASCVWHGGPRKESSSPVAPPGLCFYS